MCLNMFFLNPIFEEIVRTLFSLIDATASQTNEECVAEFTEK